MSPKNLQTEWAWLLFASLADAGVRDVVISPGSRSTPFVVAAVREKRLRRHEVVDERAAAFFALGQARVTGQPSVLLCTSGTAPAHYLPAMIEANISGVPLLVLSADRPPELYDCRSPQTIDQVKLFGENARQFFDLVPEDSETSLRAVRRIAAQAVLGTLWPRAGAVHINARARKPLEPALPSTEVERQLFARARSIAGEPMVVAPPPRLLPNPDAVAAAASIVSTSTRGLIVAGPASIAQRAAREAVWDLARATGFPLACEATSQLRFGPRPADVTFLDGLDLLLRSSSFTASRPFDAAIQIGAPPTSGAWEQLAPSLARVVLTDHGWPDPSSSARVIVYADIAASCRALVTELGGKAPRPREAMTELNERAWETAKRELEAADGGFVEAAAARALIDAAPSGSLLVLSNSLAVRLADIYARATSRDLDVASQRGASGIDGIVAGAVGAALAAERPLGLLIGDVTLLHDIGSLGLASRVRTPLVIVMLHNGGGRIFEQLPIAEAQGIEPEIVDHATTPHSTDFAPASALFGVGYTRVSDVGALSKALDAAYRHRGATLIEARVVPSGAIALSRRVAASVEAAIAPHLEPA